MDIYIIYIYILCILLSHPSAFVKATPLPHPPELLLKQSTLPHPVQLVSKLLPCPTSFC